MTHYQQGMDYKNRNMWREAFDEFVQGGEDPDCLCEVALCYLNGRGVAADVPKGVDMLNRLYNLRYPDAPLHLSNLYDLGVGVTQDHLEAFALAKEAAEWGSIPGCLKYGNLLLNKPETIDKGVELIRRAADSGLSQAVNALGVLYMAGRGVKRDVGEAIRLFDQAHREGLAEATFNLSMAYQDPHVGQVDLAKSTRLLQEACDKGYLKGYAVLGLRYMRGQGVPQDGKEARKWLFRAAEKGVPEGENLYGTCLLNGIGGERDGASARLWFEQSAAHGNPGGINNLGICYLNGIGIARDPAKAAELFEQAKDKGNPDGFFNLGLCKLDGNGVPADKAEAFRLFDEAAKRGHPTAPSFAGWCLVNGWGAKDVSRGYNLLSVMADRGERAALYYKGICTLKGWGCEVNQDQAKEYIRQAASKGFVPAKEWLNQSANAEDEAVKSAREVAATAAQEGDIDTARARWEEAAGRGDRDAMLALANLYLDGKQVPRDPEAAAIWLERAQGLGSLVADYLLADLLWKGEGTDRNQSRAIKLWQQCALLGHAPSAYRLALAYRTGAEDDKPDPIACFRWATRSAELGYKPACSLLASLYSLGEGCDKDPKAAKEWLERAQ